MKNPCPETGRSRHARKALQAASTEQLQENRFSLIIQVLGHKNDRPVGDQRLQSLVACQPGCFLGALSPFWMTVNRKNP